MCGIAGIIGISDSKKNQELIQLMIDSMAHRGPDAEGVFVEAGVALGQRRLSIIDLSDNSNQPLFDSSKRYCIIFNGEIYNYKEIKVKIDDYPFKTTGDTEVVLAAYIKWGEKCLSHLNGMFAFAIWDNVERKLFTVRDRLGIKPFYYAVKDGILAFSSELRPIIKTNLFGKKISERGLVDYLSYQSVNAPYTIIDQIWQLLPGEYAIFQNGEFIKKNYWKLGDNNIEHSFENDKSVIKTTRSLLEKAVERCMVSDVPVAAFLSGGIDSSAIVGLMAQSTSNTINTFSIVFNEKEYDESQYSAMIAKKYKTNHTPLLLHPENLLEMLPDALRAMDSPSGDGINTYAVSMLTHKHNIKVALTGLGGDELFAGYSTFKTFYDIQHKYKYYWTLPHSIRNKLAENYKTIYNNNFNTKLYTLLNATGTNIEEIYPYFRRVLPLFTIEKLLNKKISEDDNIVKQKLVDNLNNINNLPTYGQFSVAEICSYTQNVLLNDSDQMSMASSLELRVPFFDHELVEYILQVPDKWKYSKNTPKRLLVEAMGDLLPKEIVYRPKKGFSFPWEHWLRNDLKSICESNLKKLAERPQFNANEIMLLWQRFLANEKQVLWSHIWILNILEEWLSQNEI